MYDLSEESVARLLIRDAQQLADRAKEIGATAYAQKPWHRVRPNEQFLQVTLRNVESGNRRVEENAMWRQRRAQLTGHTKGEEAHVQQNAEFSGKRAQLNVDSGTHGTEEDFGVSALLSSKPVRGRGGVGSRVEETGPYLQAEPTSAKESSNSPKDDRLLGPDCPDWIRQASGPIEEATPGRRWFAVSARRE
ncbi:hypothetical protein WJX79_000423 [Trebouxia sp. C0005]